MYKHVIFFLYYVDHYYLFFSSCKNLHDIETVAKGLRKIPEFKELPLKCKMLQQKFQDMASKRLLNLEQLRTTCDDIKTTIDELHTALHGVVDHLKESTASEMNELLNAHETSIKSDIRTCSAIENTITKIAHNYHRLTGDSESTDFIIFKKSTDKLNDAESVFRTMHEQQYEINFRKDETAEQNLKAVLSFGTFNNPPPVPPRPSKDARHHVYKMETVTKLNISTKEDTKICDIVGITQLGNGHVILIDRTNQSVKLLSEQYYVLDQRSVGGAPYDVCRTGENEVAVAVEMGIHQPNIRIVIEKNIKLELGRVFHMFADTIGFYGNRLLSGWRCDLEINSFLDGTCIKALYRTPGEDDHIMKAVISDDGNMYHIVTNSGNVITVDNTGKELYAIWYTDSYWANNVCLGPEKTMFVSTMDDQILQLHSLGENILAVLASKINGVNSPQAVWFNRLTNELIVGQAADILLVLKLSKSLAI